MNLNKIIFDWIRTAPVVGGFEQMVGGWREDDLADDDDEKCFVAFQYDGGRQRTAITKQPRIMIWLVSERNADRKRNRLEEFGGVANDFDDFANELPTICGLVSTRTIGGIIGPKATDNGRTAYGLTVELIV